MKRGANQPQGGEGRRRHRHAEGGGVINLFGSFNAGYLGMLKGGAKCFHPFRVGGGGGAQP